MTPAPSGSSGGDLPGPDGPASLDDLRSMPKVELHRHLEGAVRLDTVFDLSRRAGLPLPADTVQGLAAHALITSPVAGLEDALARFVLTQESVRTLDAVRRIGREAVEDLAAENVRLAELRFSPEFLCRPGRLDWDQAMDALAEGVQEAAGRLDVVVGLVAIFSRDYGLHSGERTVAFALRHRDRLVGFDIAGSELGNPPHRYRELVRPVLDAGLGLTVHYGESGPPAYPREAVETLRPSRLGHGLSVAHDRSVQELVAERGVTLEMCPTSNWLTRGVATVAEHPAGRLLADGLRVTLNTDDPGLMGIDLTHEYEVARDALGFGTEQFRLAVSNAIEASFLPRDVKAGVRARHFAWLG
jgi:adenosine deaminase